MFFKYKLIKNSLLLSVFLGLIFITGCKKSDSDKSDKKYTTNDTTEFWRLYNVTEDNILEPDSIFKIYLDSFLVITKAFNQEKKYNSYNVIRAKRFYKQGNYDSSNAIYFKIIPSALKLGRHRDLASALSGISPNYYFLGDYPNAVKYMQMYFDTVQKYNIKSLKSHAYARLSAILRITGKPKEALNILRKGILLPERELKKENLGEMLDDIGNCYVDIFGPDTSYSNTSMAMTDSAEKYFTKSLKIRAEIFDSAGLAMGYNNLVGVYDYRKKYDKCIELINKSIQVDKLIHADADIGSAYHNLALINFETKNYILASKNLDTAFIYNNKFNDIEGNIKACNTAIEIAKASSNYNDAFKYLKRRTLLQDSIKNIEALNKVSELEIKFRTKENEKTIGEQTEKIKIQRLVNYSIIGLALLITLLSYFIFRNFKNKKQLEIQQQQQRASLQVIDAEQQERMRIARELHDGIGQKLTVLKMYASVEAEQNKKQIDLLDNTITEVRNLSHNLMPEILNLGLFIALKDMCEKINLSNQIKCDFVHNEGVENLMFTKNIEMSIYRIVQEIINNMLKHSQANLIILELNKATNKLNISIKDNGIGFDSKTIHQSKGIGWGNILARTKIINANLEVTSNSKGTNINIVINV
jgi:signal transduction histidine kinase